MTMTPKRFKAVCTETGREFWPEYQGLQDGPDMCVSKMNGLRLKSKRGLVLHNWPLYLRVPAEYTNRLKLCQFTGFKDKNGADIYENDTLIYDADIWIIEWNGTSFWMIPFDGAPEQFMEVADIMESGILDAVLSGNRWIKTGMSG